MIAILHHRATTYQILNDVRSQLMHLRTRRSGLFVERQTNPFSCKAVLDLLAEIAFAKLDELRLLISMDCFERGLREEKQTKKQKRIWLGEQRLGEQRGAENPEPQVRKKRHDTLNGILLATLLLRHTRKPMVS
jgi:hypothetical protein